jgi:hypothetical protein
LLAARLLVVFVTTLYHLGLTGSSALAHRPAGRCGCTFTALAAFDPRRTRTRCTASPGTTAAAPTPNNYATGDEAIA